jgi:enterochelin esterase-like enzyme
MLLYVTPWSHSKESPEEKGEREWAEEQLRAERKKNIRLGIAERLDETMARVQALHNQLRVQPVVREHQVGMKRRFPL